MTGSRFPGFGDQLLLTQGSFSDEAVVQGDGDRDSNGDEQETAAHERW